MKPPRRPLFLDPGRYRRRRLMDAARLLPVVGAFLFLLPILWLPESTGHRTATDGIYLFAVWAALIVIACLFAPRLAASGALTDRPAPPDAPSGVADEPPPGPPEGGKEGG